MCSRSPTAPITVTSSPRLGWARAPDGLDPLDDGLDVCVAGRRLHHDHHGFGSFSASWRWYGRDALPALDPGSTKLRARRGACRAPSEIARRNRSRSRTTTAGRRSARGCCRGGRACEARMLAGDEAADQHARPRDGRRAPGRPGCRRAARTPRISVPCSTRRWASSADCACWTIHSVAPAVAQLVQVGDHPLEGPPARAHAPDRARSRCRT